MRTMIVTAVLAFTLAAPDRARACPGPQPTATVLQLLTAADAVIPPDGALLVERTFVTAGPRAVGDEEWTLRTHDGAAVGYEVEPVSDSVERWRLTSPGTDDVEIVDQTGTVIGVVHRGRASSAPLRAPLVRRVTSTAARGTAVPPMGVLGANVVVTLVRPPPAAARFLVLASAGVDAYPHFTPAVVAGKVRYQQLTYTRKACSGGPPSTLIGDRMSVSWIDGLGRRSRARVVTVGAGSSPRTRAGADER